MKQSNLIITIMLAMFLTACGGSSTVKKDTKGTNYKEAAKINVQLASGYIQRGQLEIAKEKLDKAIEQDSGYVPAYTTMALLMDILGEEDDAESYYLEALDIDPRNPALRNNYGTFLCKQNKVDEAVKQFELAIKNQFYETPENAHANLGYCLMKAENPDYVTAEKHLRKALKVRPNMSSALLAMGELAIKTKRFLMARAYMQRYHSVASPSAESLWYQLQAEKALDDQKNFLRLSRELLKKFPDSPQADMLMDMSSK
ncbi:MAG TPA: type IV pilus biogenesis/stability protein PilW [Gammaproteobacteria bacterium]